VRDDSWCKFCIYGIIASISIVIERFISNCQSPHIHHLPPPKPRHAPRKVSADSRKTTSHSRPTGGRVRSSRLVSLPGGTSRSRTVIRNALGKLRVFEALANLFSSASKRHDLTVRRGGTCLGQGLESLGTTGSDCCSVIQEETKQMHNFRCEGCICSKLEPGILKGVGGVG
jgi:hypothetical protein